MNTKRIISFLLSAVMIFGLSVALIPTKVEAAHSPSVETESKYTTEQINAIVEAAYKYNFENAQQMLEYELDLGYLDSVKSKTGSHTIYVNRYTGVLYYVNNTTGEILTSNPYNPLTGASSDNRRKELMSQITIAFVESANTTKSDTYYSAEWAAERAQIKVSPISGGLRVNYTLGDTTTRFLLPGMLAADKFLDHILKPMFKYYENVLEEYCREEAPDAEFDFFASDTYDGIEIYDEYNGGTVSVDAMRRYLQDTQRIYNGIYEEYSKDWNTLEALNSEIFMLLQSFTPSEEELFDEDKNIIYKWVYTCNISLVSIKRQASELLRKFCPDYTMQQVIADETEVGHENKMDQKAAFRCSLEYTFNEDGSLSVRLPANSITFDQTVYTFSSIESMRYFGAGNLTEEGYVFIPDGSGSIIEFEDFYDNNNEALRENVSLKLKTYGEDYCYSMLDKHAANFEQVTMPVFGVAYETLASEKVAALSGKEKVRAGYFAILEEGSTLASMQVEFGGTLHKYGNVYTVFNPFPKDKYDLSDTISVGGQTSYEMVSESKYTGSYTTRYVMLSDAAVSVPAGVEYTPASYTGMATYYRNYLEKRGEITPLAKAENDLPLYIEAFGSIDVAKKILTFPVTVAVPLTTFENVTTMYDELANAKTRLLEKADEYDALAAAATEEKNLTLAQTHKAKADRYRELSAKVYNVTNVNFKLTGFANGGMYYTYPAKLKWEKVCGGKSGFNSLLDDVKDRQDQGLNFNVYPDFDFQYINNTSMFDGISNKGNVSKMVDNRYASKQAMNSITGEYESLFAMVISPDALDRLYSKFYSKYSDYKINNISVSTLGSDLNSNFDKKNPINREESSAYVVSLLDKMVTENQMNVMMSMGNVYSVKYAKHIIDISTDSSHFAKSSYAIPFTGLVLHGYVNYAGSALNYSGSPDYDLLRAIENGASLYYILSYQNTDALKEDIKLNKYYGVSYESWYDKVVETYAVLNGAIGQYQSYKIVDHTTLIAERVIDPIEDAANFKLLREELLEMVENQLKLKIDEAYEAMQGDDANLGRGVKAILDTDAIMQQATGLLNKTVEELCATDFDEKLAAIKASLEAEYPGKTNSVVAELKEVNYQSKYAYVTDSLATDKDYVYTEFTVDNDLVTMVTYEDPATGHKVAFIINYNIYSVRVNFGGGQEYTIPKYGFEPITIGGAQNG